MIDYATLGRKVYKIYPFIAKELITIPEISDLESISPLFGEYKRIQLPPVGKNQVTDFRLIFVAVILRLYDPDVFEFDKNMKAGLRTKLSEVLQCEGSLISHNFRIVKDYINIYPKFRNDVAYVYAELLKAYTNGFEQDREECNNTKAEEVL